MSKMAELAYEKDNYIKWLEDKLELLMEEDK